LDRAGEGGEELSVTIAIRFPLGRYHATPWDRSVNEGAVEWPPSPWRLLRALVSTWYTRWPELPAPVLDRLLDALGDPPAYRVPEAVPGHTRHYLPDTDHRKGETGATDLTLDPYLRLDRDAELLVRWDSADLTGDQRETLAKLLELVPYLGRADAVCQARLVDGDPEPDPSWWRPDGSGSESIRLLAPTRPVQRAALELGTVQVRKRRRTLPPGSGWVTYRRAAPDGGAAAAPQAAPPVVDAIRFAVLADAPFRAAHGVLLADEVHRLVTRALDGGRPDLLGHSGAATDHQHAHWVPLATDGTVGGLLVWVPRGLAADEIAAVIGVSNRQMSGRRGGNGYEIKGFPPSRLLLQAAGRVEQVAPELCGPARVWHSRTPYLPVRHRKRESLDDYLAADVAAELRYRGVAAAVTVTRPDPDDGLPDRWARGFRRYRADEHMGQARRGLGLRLELDAPVCGPLLLGQLSHFGFGLFTPDPEPTPPPG
jgi:CRISPR-associated protein Csb2